MVLRLDKEDSAEIDLFRRTLSERASAIDRPLGGEAIDRMTIHFRLLRLWGRRMNLTGLRDLGAIVDRHYLEPIAAATLIGGTGVLLDLGSGNGFPALPLQILHPGIEVVLLEASEKKSAFLLAVVRELGLKSARVVTRRACRRADLAEFLPVRWLTFRGVRGFEMLRGERPNLLDADGKLLAFVSAVDARPLRNDPPFGLDWIRDMALPTSPGDVVSVFGPRSQ